MEAKARREHIAAIEQLRGLVIITLVLGQVPYFLKLSSEQLTLSESVVFFLSWLSHFCIPAFVFLTGLRIYFSSLEMKDTPGAWKFLLGCGLCLILLGWNLAFWNPIPVVLLTAGWIMITKGSLIVLPLRVVQAIVLIITVLANCINYNIMEKFGSAAQMLSGLIQATTLIPLGDLRVVRLEPLVTLLVVLAAGYIAGPLWKFPVEERRRKLFTIGATATVAFILLRLAAIFSSPQPWPQHYTLTLKLYTFFRFDNSPASIYYLLMTLGPTMVALSWFDRIRLSDRNPLLVFGRVPLFFYLLHFCLAHAIAILLSGISLGLWDLPLAFPFSSLSFKNEYPFGLGFTYFVWISIVASLYLP